MELFAVLLVFGAVFSLVLGLAWREESPVSNRLASLLSDRPVYDYPTKEKSAPITSRVFAPLADSIAAKLGALLPTTWIKMIESDLIKAGQPVTLTGFLVAAVISAGAGTGFGLTMVLSSTVTGQQALLVLGGCVAMGFYLPRMWLGGRVRMRQKEILKSLPDAFDLITTCVEAGLGLEAAMARVAEKVEGPFGEELGLSLREVAMGKLRRDALKELAARTGVGDLTSFINAVIQAESMGTSIATVLRVQAEQMRMRRRQRAEKQAQQAPVKMIFPLVLCIFPTLFLIILGPAALRIVEELGGR